MPTRRVDCLPLLVATGLSAATVGVCCVVMARDSRSRGVDVEDGDGCVLSYGLTCRADLDEAHKIGRRR